MKSSKTIINDYLSWEDWRCKENSTVTNSLGGLILYNSGTVTSDYWLNVVYDKEISEAHKNADIHIHDLSILSGYCAGWSLKQLIKEGLGGVVGKITSSPATHLSTLCNQMVNFLGIMQNEWAGAQAFSSFDTYLAPFVKIDNLSYREVKQCVQSFVYGVNTPSRWGTQAPFTNITLDWTVPADLAELNCIVGGKEVDFKYKDCKKEMDMVNKAFIEIMIEGDANGRGFQYPIPTYSITRDFDWSETENNKLLFEMTAKYGTPYFSNYINSDMEPSDVRSMCLTPDTQVCAKFNGKFTKCSIQYLYENADVNTLILTKHGYRPIKEVQRFKYVGNMIRFTTESGKTITSTVDHEHVVYDRECVNSKKAKLIKKRATDIKIGEFFSCRKPNPGELRKGLTYGGLSEEWREKISIGLEGRYISENCRATSSKKWLGENNPCKTLGSCACSKQCCVSLYEDALSLDDSSYRPYINSAEQIVGINCFEYCGYVYDLEVDCDDIGGDTTLYHTFYANDILTGNCCRLRLDLRELRKKSGGFFGSGESTGSVGVVTINMPRLAYLADSKEDFYNKLDHIMDVSARSLSVKREFITKLLDDGLFPYTKRYLGTFSNHFSTIGLVGMNEACLNAKWLKCDLTSEVAQDFAVECLNHMREKLSDYQELYGDLYNLEATPAESTAYRLAKHDVERYPDIITAGEPGSPYYTNSSHLPVTYTDDVFSALDIQDKLQTLYTSGTVFHTFLGEKLPNWQSAMCLVKTIAENYKLPYYTMSPTYSICKNHGYINGEVYTCPDCGEETEVYSRITGYYRPVKNWNVGKSQEFRERLEYSMSGTTGEEFVESNNTVWTEEDANGAIEYTTECASSWSDEYEYILISTTVCPNCEEACKLLDGTINYTKLTEKDDAFIDYVEAHNITQVPVLVEKSKNFGSETLFHGLSTIKSYVNTFYSEEK